MSLLSYEEALPIVEEMIRRRATYSVRNNDDGTVTVTFYPLDEEPRRCECDENGVKCRCAIGNDDDF